MICPRCGNEWDATRGACNRCGFVVRMPGQSGSYSNLPNMYQSNSQQSGGLASPKQQSDGMSPVKQQSGGLTTPAQPGFPRTVRPTPMTPTPQQGSNYGSANSPSNGAFAKPAIEKIPLRGAPQGTQQTGMRGADSVSYRNDIQSAAPTFPTQRSTGYPQQDMRHSQAPMQPQSPMRQYAPESFTRNSPNQQMARSASSVQQASNALSPMRSNVTISSARPLLPGVLLRGGRYRLQELQERQDWLSGVFEAVWIGRDSHRGGSQVLIREVVLPDNTSVMTQTVLRTATMTLASIGRHPHIPALWDAFSDQGRSFFVFEPIEGESLMTRMRYSGRALPEQEVIECCLQMTDVLELLAQQSPQLVHGLIRPEHIILSRNGAQFILTNFSVVLAGGATQYIVGMERSHLSSYTAPEFIRGVVDVRTDMYSLIATAYHAVTGSVPAGISGSIPYAQRINPNISSAFDAILAKGLRSVPNQRYQRPAELRQDLLAMRSVSGTLVSGNGSNSAFQQHIPSFGSNIGQRTDAPFQRVPDHVAQALPLLLNPTEDVEDQVSLLPKPEDLPPMKAANDSLNAVLLLSLILICLIVIVVLSHMTA
jgi:serine/threonine protein kinase